VQAFSGLPSDSPLIFRSTSLMYLGACAVCGRARSCAMPDVFAWSCSSVVVVLALSLFVLTGVTSRFPRCSSSRSTSNHGWPCPTNHRPYLSFWFDSAVLS
jgi:hypothetical protein